MNIANQMPLTLCASARLVHHIRANIHTQNLSAGQQKWQTTPICALNQWLNEVVENAVLLGEIDASSAPNGMLNANQEALLWEQSIKKCLQDNDTSPLFNITGLASAAMEANRYIIEWNISIDPNQTTEETKQFLVWRNHFQNLCKQSGYLEQVRYIAWQLNQLSKANFNCPSVVKLVGFDRINPHLNHLTKLLTAKGINVDSLQLSTPTQSIQVIACNEQMDECRAAIAWAKNMLEENPNAQIAIVVPELEKLRPTLLNLLDDTFHPQSLHPAFSDIPRIYECSLGLALTQWPIVKTALSLLRFALQKSAQAQNEISSLILDIYWSSSITEADHRALLDARMRKMLPLNLQPNTFVKWVNQIHDEPNTYKCPIFQSHLNALLIHANQTPKQQAPSAWANCFTQLLTLTQWQGERALSSVEYQTVERFKQCLSEMACLDGWLGYINATEALQRLTQICQSQVFQPETITKPKIMVMGMLEASAQYLDATWVMGMNDHLWPPLARTNTLISAELQRKAQSPNASSQLQTEFAQSIHHRLLCSTKQITFSFAEKDGDKLLRISPLLHDLPKSNKVNLTLKTLAEQLALASQQDWEWLDDAQAPPVLTGEHIAGGTKLLKAQAICPAWAFYQYRLNTNAINTPKNGLDAMERGQLIHAVLAKFWESHKSIDLHTIKNQLDVIAKDVMDTFNSKHHDRFSEVFLSLEQERLSHLALAWLLDADAIRPTPFKVEACEKEVTTIIEGIQIKLIIDRIDRLEDGQLVVIDYKTASHLCYKNWADKAITEPQLPIYAAFVLEQETIAAVCFAQVRTASNKFVGIAAHENIIQNIEVFNNDKHRGGRTFDAMQFKDWSAIINHWRNRITETAISLKNGDASVCFENEKDLIYCEVLPLLRLPERHLQFENSHANK